MNKPQRFSEMVQFAAAADTLHCIGSRWPNFALILKSHSKAAVHAIRAAILAFYRENYEINWTFNENDDPKAPWPSFYDKLRSRIKQQPVTRVTTGLRDTLQPFPITPYGSRSYGSSETNQFDSLESDSRDKIEPLVFSLIREEIMKDCLKMYREKLPNWPRISSNVATFELNHSGNRESSQVAVFWRANGWVEARDKAGCIGLSRCEAILRGTPDLMVFVLNLANMDEIETKIKVGADQNWAQIFEEQAIADGVLGKTIDYYL
jgi:hypothetical protein